ncbi:MAG: PAS domain S-box protein, partial [Chloroflexota bacterium]
MTNSSESQNEIIARLQQALEEKERQLAREITRRRRSDAALRTARAELEERINAAIDSLPGLFYLFDEQGRFRRWNKSFEVISGYSADEIADMHPLDFFVGEDKSLIAARIQEAFETGAATIEAEFVAKDGRKTPYLFTARRTSVNNVPCLVGMGVDLSEQKRMEKELQYLAARLQVMLNNLTIIANEIDADGIFLLSRGKGLENLGLQPDQLVGASVFEIYREYPVIIEATRRALAGEVQHFEVEVAGVVWDSNFIPLVDEQGEVERVFGTGVNVTERKRAEEALQRSQAQLQHIVDTVPEGVLLLDTAGQVILANPVAEAYLHLLVPDQENGPLTHLGDRSLVELLTSPPKGLWHEINMTDRCFETIARPVESNPGHMGWVLVVRDVTQRREIQKQVQEQERLSAVGQLAAGIAHDFNNILAAMVLHVQIMQRTAKLPPAIQKGLEMIEQQAYRAADLTQQILDFSRQSLLARQPLDLVAFLQDLTVLFRRTLPENVSIELDYDPAAYAIYADPSRMQQVVMNLAVNARDAMPQGGRLQFSLAHLSLATADTPPVPEMTSGDWIVLRVADSGTGIPPQTLGRIFEPFFTTKEVGKGVGLGLAQVYGIVQQHDGYLDVETEIGQGTTFLLYFPALTAEGIETTEPDTTTLLQGQGQTILVVEDDAAIRQAIVQSLQLIDYQVIAAENGREALA